MKKRDDKKACSAEEGNSDSSSSGSESGGEDDDIDAYHMRIVRNSGYGYPMMGGNIDSVTNQSPFYGVKDEQETAVHGETMVESYATMRVKHKTYAFTLDSAANGNIAPWTDGLE